VSRGGGSIRVVFRHSGIRKANLCRADLRGAKIDGVDFYLVDLRGAPYDPDQEAVFRKYGAILDARLLCRSGGVAAISD
jgi:uncharacterized protein YjbI with pentapeptide repeats